MNTRLRLIVARRSRNSPRTIETATAAGIGTNASAANQGGINALLTEGVRRRDDYERRCHAKRDQCTLPDASGSRMERQIVRARPKNVAATSAHKATCIPV